jgi:hypothetical protein
MERRDFVRAGLAAGALGPAAAVRPADDRHWYELRLYELRSDMAPNRLRTFFGEQLLPALKRAGAGAVGVFTAEAGFPGQTLVVVIEHASAADAIAIEQRLANDAVYSAALQTLESDPQPPYVRYESRLMRAFAGHPELEVPPARAGRGRLFELRTYESRSTASLAKKIAMFNEAEIALFRSIGMTPVFFGENVFATRLPSLTYMLVFDDMAARQQAWATFGSHPDWQRISKDPRWNVEGVTTMTNAAYLNPVAFSPIR